MNFLLTVNSLALRVLKVIKIDVFGTPLRCHIRSSVEIMVGFEKRCISGLLLVTKYINAIYSGV